MAIDLGSGVGALVGSRPDYGRGTRSLFEAVLRNAAGKPVFTADYYAVDGVTGKVAAFVDWNDASHTLAQATSASQVAVPQADASFAGQLTVTASAQRYTSSRAASAFRYLHDGTGCSIVHAFANGASGASAVLSATCRNNAAVTGHNFYFPSTTSTPNARALTRNGATTVFSLVSAPSVVLGVPTWATQDYSGAAVTVYTRTQRADGTVLAAPAAGDSDRTLNFLDGDPGVTPFPFVGRWVFSAYLPYLAPDQRYVIARFMRERYGI